MLGIEHVTRRGSIVMEYFGRDVSVKIMPTGVKPERFLGGFDWGDTQWRRGELASQVGWSTAGSCNEAIWGCFDAWLF